MQVYDLPAAAAGSDSASLAGDKSKLDREADTEVAVFDPGSKKLRPPGSRSVGWALVQAARLHRARTGDRLAKIGLFAGQEQVVQALSQRAFPVTRPQHDERTALAPQGIVPDDAPATNRPP